MEYCEGTDDSDMLITIEEGNAKVTGYMSFSANFCFKPDGSFKEIEIYE